MDRATYQSLIAPAIDMVVKKGQDYNSKVQLHDYFPFGNPSYVQMIHLKSTRLISLVENPNPNYEGKIDTVLDLMNYCVFYLEYLRAVEGEGQ